MYKMKKSIALSVVILVGLLGVGTTMTASATGSCLVEKQILKLCMKSNFRAPSWCYQEKNNYIECLANPNHLGQQPKSFWALISQRND